MRTSDSHHDGGTSRVRGGRLHCLVTTVYRHASPGTAVGHSGPTGTCGDTDTDRALKRDTLIPKFLLHSRGTRRPRGASTLPRPAQSAVRARFVSEQEGT